MKIHITQIRAITVNNKTLTAIDTRSQKKKHTQTLRHYYNTHTPDTGPYSQTNLVSQEPDTHNHTTATTYISAVDTD